MFLGYFCQIIHINRQKEGDFMRRTVAILICDLCEKILRIGKKYHFDSYITQDKKHYCKDCISKEMKLTKFEDRIDLK